VLLRGFKQEQRVADRGEFGDGRFEIERIKKSAGEFDRTAVGGGAELRILRSDLTDREVDNVFDIRWARQQRRVIGLDRR